MRELLRVVEEPRPCPYLPTEKASLEYRIVVDLDAAVYADLLRRGYRRFGYQLYRPACTECDQCVSLRVLVNEFALSPSQRRVLRLNRHIRAERRPAFVSDQHIELFNRYHRFMAMHRGWQRDAITSEAYVESFVAGGGSFSWQWLYYDGPRLVGVALMDEVEDAISLVYYFHDPAWRPLSPGTFSVLTQLAYAKERKLPYAYPGYWVAPNSSMSYKVHFRPHERLAWYPEDGQVPCWVRVEA
jgi:arginine-tRNA-protein transferase